MEEISELDVVKFALDYCPDTGIFRYRHSAHGRNRGDIAGNIMKDGYWQIAVNGKRYMAHRLAWLIMTGAHPDKQKDHINLIKSDNRWCNLRPATPSQNNANWAARGKYGKGVTFHHQCQKYQAQIKVQGKSHYLGLFNTQEDAHAAYAKAANDHYGEFARAS